VLQIAPLVHVVMVVHVLVLPVDIHVHVMQDILVLRVIQVWTRFIIHAFKLAVIINDDGMSPFNLFMESFL
jgi:hypothetical protein